MEALYTEDGSKYASSGNMLPDLTEGDVEETRSDFISATLHFQGRIDFRPELPSQSCCAISIS